MIFKANQCADSRRRLQVSMGSFDLQLWTRIGTMNGVRSGRRPGAQRVRMQAVSWGGFRHKQAVGAAATGDRSRSKGGFMGRGMPRVSSVSNEPPLPGPLLHLMEEREFWLRRRRSGQSVVKHSRFL